jgi:hypothetical protein
MGRRDNGRQKRSVEKGMGGEESLEDPRFHQSTLAALESITLLYMGWGMLSE